MYGSVLEHNPWSHQLIYLIETDFTVILYASNFTGMNIDIYQISLQHLQIHKTVEDVPERSLQWLEGYVLHNLGAPTTSQEQHIPQLPIVELNLGLG